MSTDTKFNLAGLALFLIVLAMLHFKMYIAVALLYSLAMLLFIFG